MGTERRLRSTAEKLALFRERFSGLSHVYGTYNPRSGQARQVKQPVTDTVLLRHLRGQEPYGVYLLVGDRTRAVVADFDDDDADRPCAFVRHASEFGLHAYLERSRRKGWHVWVFGVSPDVDAAKARVVMRAMLERLGMRNTEVFPKHDRLTGTTFYGNFINAPLFGALVPQARTVFVDPQRGLVPFEDQWDFLANARRVTEDQLDDIISRVKPQIGRGAGQNVAQGSAPVSSPPVFGLPPCAQRMLAEGVTEYQRVACFRIALHLRRAGIPQDIASAALRAWAPKNRPQHGKRIITATEIDDQVKCAYVKSYRSCGCEELVVAAFCKESCRIRGDRYMVTEPTSGASSSSTI